MFLQLFGTIKLKPSVKFQNCEISISLKKNLRILILSAFISTIKTKIHFNCNDQNKLSKFLVSIKAKVLRHETLV